MRWFQWFLLAHSLKVEGSNGLQKLYQHTFLNFLPLLIVSVYFYQAPTLQKIQPLAAKGYASLDPNPQRGTLRNHPPSYLDYLEQQKKTITQGSWWKEKQWRPTTSHAPEQMTFRLWEEAQFFSSVFCSLSVSTRSALLLPFVPVVARRSNVSAGVWLSERPRALCRRNHRRPCREISRVHAFAPLTAAPIISN